MNKYIVSLFFVVLVAMVTGCSSSPAQRQAWAARVGNGVDQTQGIAASTLPPYWTVPPGGSYTENTFGDTIKVKATGVYGDYQYEAPKPPIMIWSGREDPRGVQSSYTEWAIPISPPGKAGKKLGR